MATRRNPVTREADVVRLPPYAHSPVHTCVINNDLTELRRQLASLPRLSPPSKIRTAAAAARETQAADAISAVLDRRDVPNRETPLHLAVRLYRPAIAAALLSAGADPSLQNSSGWNAFQESVLLRQPKSFSLLILRHHRLSSLQKWRRRLPSVLAAVCNIRDFYLEIGFRFESPVIPPFVLSRALPSDTYKVWKRGERMRVDTSLDGFDGLRVSRSRRTFLFLGDANGCGNGDLDDGTVLELNHDRKEIRDVLEEERWEEEEEELVGEAAAGKVFRPGVDVTKAELVGRTNWRRKEKIEMVGEWKTKVYEIHNVFCTIKTRAPVACGTVAEPLPDLVIGNDDEDEGFLVAELPPPRRNSVSAVPSRRSSVKLSQGKDDGNLGNIEWDFTGAGDNPGPVNGVAPPRHSCVEFSRPRRRGSKTSSCGESGRETDGSGGGGIEWDLVAVEEEPPMAEKAAASRPRRSCYEPRWRQNSKVEDGGCRSVEREKDEKVRKKGSDVRRRDFERLSSGVHWGGGYGKVGRDNEVKRSLRPTVWLTEDFPIKTEEVIPLLDVIANKVKAALRLRELLTTKFPAGTFPVKLAIPVVASVRVVVNFTKFVELPPAPEEEFFTPPSSPAELTTTEDDDHKRSDHGTRSSWLRWSGSNSRPRPSSHSKLAVASPSPPLSGDGNDPFAVPGDYAWVSSCSSRYRKKPQASTLH